MKIEWGNFPQWISALCALALSLLALYGLFFSTTSQTLVAYLQSELVARNQRVSALELREHELQLSVQAAQSSLTTLNRQKSLLEDQVATLDKERESLSRKVSDLNGVLSATEFSLIKQKIGIKLSSGLIGPSTTALWNELASRHGLQKLRARTEIPWTKFIIFLEQAAKELPESEQPIARKVLASFVNQCHMDNLDIDKGVVVIPDVEHSQLPGALDWESLVLSILRVQSAIERCFLSVTPQ